ncbi:MAG TPA: MurR/RpiR family transcriptional regulator [Candidatus Mediterraneibacter avicola]|nr:MurR/RpiR family transcriptional regulator [Candidatus Mediterraneibacter avicola]
MKNYITKQIEAGYGDLRRSEKQAADYILSHMEEAADLPLDRLAYSAKVSQPTVLRMLKALGFNGYKDFRYQLVAELARETDREKPDQIMYGYTLSRQDTLEEIPIKMAATTQRMMEETLKNFSGKNYQKAVQKLKKARLIDIYSVENSEVTAMDLLTKLLYLGLPCRHFSDYYFQRISAGSLTSEDVAVGISYSGESKDTVDVMRTARKAGACTIVITNFRDSTIAKYADILICTSQEQFFYGDAIFSRTTQLLIVDMIYMGIIASDYERYVEQLNRCEKVVREKAYDNRKRR